MGKESGKDAAPPLGLDNNKRLAQLESNLEALSVALTEAGVEHEQGSSDTMAIAGGFVLRASVSLAALAVAVAAAKGVDTIGDSDPVELAIPELESKTRLAIEHNRLVAERAELADYLTEKHGQDFTKAGHATPGQVAIELIEQFSKPLFVVDGGDGNATEGELAAIARADAAEAKVTSLEEDLTAAEAKIAAADRANPGKPRGKGKSVRARAVHATKRSQRGDLALVMAGDEPLEVVMCDGKLEIVELEPLEVTPSSFVKGPNGYMLIQPIQVTGVASEVRVRGFGLFLDGKQIEYCALPEPAIIKPGQTRKFERTIFF